MLSFIEIFKGDSVRIVRHHRVAARQQHRSYDSVKMSSFI